MTIWLIEHDGGGDCWPIGYTLYPKTYIQKYIKEMGGEVIDMPAHKGYSIALSNSAVHITPLPCEDEKND